MSKIYNKLQNDFTQIPNHILQDTRISALAFKIYCYICFRIGINAEWEFFNDEIQRHFKEGRDAFMKAKKQLMQYGYLQKVAQNHKGKNGFSGCDYIIYKEPNQTTENQTTENQASDNTSTNNIYINNIDTNNIKYNISSVLEKQDNSNDEFNLFWKEWQSIINRKTEVKKKAEKEFNKIKDKEKLNLALKNLKADIENKKIEPKFVKHLERWLRDEVWKEYLQCSSISTTIIPNSVHFEKNQDIEYTLSQYRNNHISQLIEISKATKSKCINIYDNCYNTFVNNIASNIYKTEYKANTQEGVNLMLQLNDDMTNTPTLKHLKENLNEINRYIQNTQNDFCVSKTIVKEIQQDFHAKLQKAKDTMIGDMASYLVNKECQRVYEYQKAKDSSYRELSNDKKNIIIDFLKNKSMLYIDCVYMDQNQYPKVDEIEKNILQKNNEIEKNKKFISNFTSNVLEMNEKALEDNLLNIYREIYINLKKHLTL